jgi:diadenosine tetraphosphatase ApaH/serine/threonine PP2A family protein phosphatase
VRIRQITLRSDEPLNVELLTGDDFILSVWAPTGQRVWEEQVTGPGRHAIPAFVFGRGMHLVQVRTARGEVYVYRVLGL